MKHNFCTLFDKNFIYRGLAMYESLLETDRDFKLWILCMDDIVYEQLKKMNLRATELIKLTDFEKGDSELLEIKLRRTMVEYCWTLSSSLPLYVFKHNPDLHSVAYLDSDLYFFSNSESIYEEMGDSSIGIVRHNYSKELTYLEKKSGIYNVSMVIFKNDDKARQCLEWWRERCLEWCYAYYEDGKLGDQMYLDDWPKRFDGVHVIKNKGANVAPWNLNKYLIKKEGEKIYVDEDQLIFYHFHSFKMYGINSFQLYYSSYLISKHDKEIFYPVYIKKIQKLIHKFISKFPDYTSGFNEVPSRIAIVRGFLKRKLSIYYYIKSLYNR